MCADLPECLRAVLGMLLLPVPTIIMYLIWSGITR